MSGKIEHLVKQYRTREELSQRGVWRGELYRPEELRYFERGWCWKTLLLGEEDDLVTNLESVQIGDEPVRERDSREMPGVRRLTPVTAISHPLEVDDDPLKENIPLEDTLDIVRLDVDRLLLDPVFANEATKEEMIKILYNYVLENETSYKQGYHEICGAVYLQMRKEDAEARTVNTFNIFNKLMSRVRPVFYEEEALLKWSRERFDAIFKCTAPKLYELLVKHHGMDNTVWLIRWSRLLFLRELELGYALRIWDHLLTFSYPLADLVACTIVVMLIVISQELHTCEDQGEVISLLLHYPPEKLIDCTDLMKYSASLYELFASRQYEDMYGVGQTLSKIYNHDWYDKIAAVPDQNRLRLEERLKRRVEMRLKK